MSVEAPEILAIKLRIPDDADPVWISEAMDRIQKANLNCIILETFYHGYTIFDSDTARSAGITSQRPAFRGWDPLEVVLDEAHLRGFKVFAWVETLYVGSDLIEGVGPVIGTHSSWSARRKNGSMTPAVEEQDHYFLCPANPEVRDYAVSLCSEVSRNYPIDGLFVDYLRFPHGAIGPDDAFCYCETCRKRVRDELLSFA